MNNNALFYTCSLIEFITRTTKHTHNEIIGMLGTNIDRMYKYHDVFHCEPIEKVADDFIQRANIDIGSTDYISTCQYDIPDYWDIGEVFQRLVEDCFTPDNYIHGIKEVFSSWIAIKLSNYNSDLYYQPRDYLAECYRVGELLVA